jgi:hypothetical protein
MIPLPTRREHESYDLPGGKLGEFTLRIGRHPDTDQVIEVFFDQRGKVGTELNQFLHDAGVLISKVLQGKEPE